MHNLVIVKKDRDQGLHRVHPRTRLYDPIRGRMRLKVGAWKTAYGRNLS